MSKKKTLIIALFIIITGFVLQFLFNNLFLKGNIFSRNKTIISNKINFHEQTKFYFVTGSTEQELRDSMDNFGPKDDFRRNDALTSWDIYWDYDYEEKDNLCSLKNLKVDLKIVYTYPKFDNLEKVNDNLKAKWNKFLISLKLHETGHKNIAVEGANNVLRGLLVIKSYNSCDILDKEVENKAQSIISELKNKEEQYDIETEHGNTQGTDFP